MIASSLQKLAMIGVPNIHSSAAKWTTMDTRCLNRDQPFFLPNVIGQIVVRELVYPKLSTQLLYRIIMLSSID